MAQQEKQLLFGLSSEVPLKYNCFCGFRRELKAGVQRELEPLQTQLTRKLSCTALKVWGSS